MKANHWFYGQPHGFHDPHQIANLLKQEQQPVKSDAIFDTCKMITDVSLKAYSEGRRDERQELLNELRARCPYKEFCVQPVKCAGLGSCPRDPCCAD